MNKYKIFNNIAEDGLSILSDHQFEEVAENPDGLLLRSHKLTEKEFIVISCNGTGWKTINEKQLDNYKKYVKLSLDNKLINNLES